jgi:multiple sugar transport system substrate-binding protein
LTALENRENKMGNNLSLDRRRFVTGAAAAALGLTMTKRASFADANQVVLDSFKGADVDWTAFKGEKPDDWAMTHPWSAAIEPALPLFTELTGISKSS